VKISGMKELRNLVYCGN